MKNIITVASIALLVTTLSGCSLICRVCAEPDPIIVEKDTLTTEQRALLRTPPVFVDDTHLDFDANINDVTWIVVTPEYDDIWTRPRTPLLIALDEDGYTELSVLMKLLNDRIAILKKQNTVLQNYIDRLTNPE